MKFTREFEQAVSEIVFELRDVIIEELQDVIDQESSAEEWHEAKFNAYMLATSYLRDSLVLNEL